MTRLGRLKRIGADDEGVTVIEFALVALPLCMILLVMFDFGYRSYIGAGVEGTVHRAARLATVGGQTSDQIDTYVRGQIQAYASNATITITKRSYSQFSGVGVGEKWQETTDTKSPYHNGVYDAGHECYYDANNNGKYDNASSAGTTGLGGSDDIVYYSVKVDFPAIVPVDRLMGWDSMETVTANTVMRNQPYGSQAVVQCKL
ncbi:TadE/TadG family type IV pilus assembly protein [Flavisphingomonas formosensis]|uniref:TadE/TadG family type IV pilus assembly protein n=1 Tax=Flavisphingomonas formosensis TaxID=861534 RepID=UPI001E4394B5|nr:TadE/TadG family type IV pilus assembly protein [Sphingomonas formosensis]